MPRVQITEIAIARQRFIRWGLGAALALMLVARAAAAAAAAGADLDVDALSRDFKLLPESGRLALGARAECGLDDCSTRLALQAPDATPGAATDTTVSAAPERQPNWLLTSLVSVGAIGGSALNSFLDGPRHSYHFSNEGWFGQNTPSGGADKASHFVDYYIVSKEFAHLFVKLGHKPEFARWLGAGVSTLTGLMTEVGDGATRYGFSYQDFVMDFGGAVSAALISQFGAEDLLGFRHGFLLDSSSGDRCCPFPGFNRDYSNEIYTADLHLSGVSRRLGVPFGPAKYLLLSLTYGTKNYPGDDSQRQVGLEIGLDLRTILDDLSVTRDRWWGYLLHVVADNVRFPFTAVGMRYDLNHGRWYGPDAGNSGNKK